MSDKIALLEQGHPIAFSFEDMMKHHGRGLSVMSAAADEVYDVTDPRS